LGQTFLSTPNKKYPDTSLRAQRQIEDCAEKNWRNADFCADFYILF
jgi:hypothetical protein